MQMRCQKDVGTKMHKCLVMKYHIIFPCLPTFIKVKYNLKAKLNTTYNVVSDGQTLNFSNRKSHSI